jgi:hypothetical protein
LARAHKSTAQIGGRQYVKSSEKIWNYVVSKQFTNNADISKSFAACLKTAVSRKNLQLALKLLLTYATSFNTVP